ncbi:MAG: ankyrin repeat domain-containing protein, partial [Gammaproteobacteria bacterium]
MDLADAIIYGDLESVKHAIELGLEINEIDKYGFSPLIESIIVDKPDITKLLLEKGAWVDGIDLTGRTPLYWAVECRNLPICKLLLDHKADPNAYTKACQPILTLPLLRRQEDVKDMLYYHGANLSFAQDYINTKLIGHRFELSGKIHMLSCDGQFILVDFEGFFLEFTLGIIQDSLRRYKNNYAARHMTHLFPKIDRIIESLTIATELIRYQHFSIKYQEFEDKIDRLLDYPLLLIPIAYEGHAITCIRYGDLWIKCDRGFNSQIEGSVVIYRSLRPKLINKKFIKNLIYRKNSHEYVNEGMNEQIGLVKIGEMPLPA